MKKSDTINEGNPSHNEYINHRMGEIKEILRKLAESFTKFLFAAHSGGILAIVATIKFQSNSTGFYPKIALTSFVIGILLTAFLLIRMLFRMYGVDKAWHKNTDHWYKGTINWGELNERDDMLTDNDKIEFTLAIASFTVFTIGAFFALTSIWFS